MKQFNPAGAGEVLASFIEGRKIADFADEIGVTRVALSRVLHGHAAVSAEMAIRLGKALKTDPEFWLRIQMKRDLWVAEQKLKEISKVRNIKVSLARKSSKRSAA